MATSVTRRRGMVSRSSQAGRSYGYSPKTHADYRTVTNTFKWKISSYQTLWKQIQGPAKYHRPSPVALNSLAKWVDKGAVIQTVTNAQLKRWSRTNKTFTSPTSAKKVLFNKFGKAPIKAIYCDKGGNFLVATSPTFNGKQFKFPR
jgi:hypothetical protein